MLYNIMLKKIWFILFLIALGGYFILKKTTYIYIYIIGEAFIFIIDFLINNKYYDKNNRKAVVKRNWHILANFCQWTFWAAILYVPLMTGLNFGYKVFILIDTFIASTFATYKFIHKNM